MVEQLENNAIQELQFAMIQVWLYGIKCHNAHLNYQLIKFGFNSLETGYPFHWKNDLAYCNFAHS